MEDEGDDILGAIYEADDQGDIDDDVEMVDVEEGEVIDADARSRLCVLRDAEDDDSASKQVPKSRNQRRRSIKRKNKRKRRSPGTDIDRFVLDTCRRLKEKKSYMVYTAIGCLGVSTLSDIVKEVDVIQACGGQLTADGKRQRTGGGVLWSIIKAREPDAYQKIMKGAKEFEKLFRACHVQQRTDKMASCGCAEERAEKQHPSDGSSKIPPLHDSIGLSIGEEKKRSVKDQIRMPVSYDDIAGEPSDDATVTISG